MTIPLIIDYLLTSTREICDEEELAKFLRIGEGIVRKALERLKDHGILKDEEIKKKFYKDLKDKL